MQVDPNEDTEWNDILRAHGIIPEKEKDPTEQLEEALAEAVQKQHENRLENKTLDELDELEDEEDEEFLQQYKQKRIAEMNRLAARAKYGTVYPITKPEYKQQVTDASQDCFVVVHMSLQSALQSRLLASLLAQLAPRLPDVKFVDIPADRAVENYPEANCPTLLVYHKGDVVKQAVTLAQLGGNQTKLADLESWLCSTGAVAETDSRLSINRLDEDLEESRQTRFVKKSLRGSNLSDDDDDDFFD
ncbi:phosducin-like protein [Ogataea parapolymorpha DL-1]|uniref:Phosducin-like protein n=1 Tax=Ogataea parapolymorpha (strain ATCC 26012 / BCRC 20466 / JCM 22074 / NRRL Y-7560 / DL-1) TaxID=871575 RepID=W1QHA2_OGAPD|nr:phosducin-like protein [Ogataea parapolymorpha DL-1]ESX01427.1 phosducin-like protein [Ogataea parapolymorpha DL-1]